MNRRSFLSAAGVGGVATLCCACHTPAGQGGIGSSGGRIDVHHHVMPPAWLKEARQQISAAVNFSTVGNWSVQKSLDDMDMNGIATVISSITAPGIWFGNVAESRRLARACNDYMAQLSRDHPGRFGSFAALPLPDVEGSLREAAYALDVLKADGIGLLTSYDDKWPGDPAFAPVFEELDRRRAVVYFHPTATACCVARMPGVSLSAVEFPVDTTRAVTSLLYSGAFSRYRNIRWILSHGGAAIPPLAYRIEANIRSRKELSDRVPFGALHELRRLYYDTALAANAPAMGGLLKLVDAGQVLFGSDFPFGVTRPTLEGLSDLRLSGADLRAIEGGNARKLLGRKA